MNRAKLLAQVTDTSTLWDIVVIGGGATGLGTALDAATRGYKTLLLEQADFAKGTSSRSTKLIHGGVRYLAQGQVKLVLEALRERGLLLQNAPHVVNKLSFVIPAYSWWQAAFYLAGLKLYDLLAGKWSLGASSFLSKRETTQALPTVKTHRLKGGILYYDGQFDDTRLAIELARAAAAHGAAVLNYMRVTELLKNKEAKITGVRALDQESGQIHTIRAKAVINATGVFVDEVLRMERPEAPPLICPSQGVHIVLDKSFLPGAAALLIPETDDRRVLFAVPWHNHLLVGTTDTVREQPQLEPQPLQQEVDFILATAARYLTRSPTLADIKSVFAGLRPLANQEGNRSTKEISRNYKVALSPAGLVTVIGGKWTIYRKMAEDAVTKAAAAHGLPHRPCLTANLPLCGQTLPAPPAGTPLAGYGDAAGGIAQLIKRQPELAKRLHPSFTYSRAEVVWAAREEMARTVEDVLARRLRLLFLDARAAMDVASEVAGILAEELHKDRAWQQKQIEEFEELALRYTVQLTP